MSVVGMGDNKSPDTVEEKQPLATEEENGTIPGGEDLDSSKVKFISANGGATADAVVDIDGQTKPAEDEFVGLTKEQLLEYANDPYWKKVRWVLLILFWVAWFGMLIAAIIIILLAPSCPPRPNMDWWQTSNVYQVYPRSFKDSDGNGVGDLKGLEQKLDYLRTKLNVTALWLNPIYPSPMKDFGYDISDHMDVDELFGDLDEFRNLRVAVHKRGMKLIIDYVPNHVSDQHEWFKESRKNKNDDNSFRDYFIWSDGKDNGGAQPDPPNNWLSVYGGSAWTWDDTRQQYYYHTYLPEQPDLNLRNMEVVDGLKNVLRFWITKDVDGFHISSAANLFESVDLSVDEQAAPDANAGSTDYNSLLHNLTTFQPETYNFIAELREIIDASFEMDGKKRVLLVDAAGGTMNQTMSFYEHNGKAVAHMPINNNLLTMKKDCNGLCVNNLVQTWMHNLPKGQWGNWMTGNPDYSRVATRMEGQDWVNSVNMLVNTLPGTAITYYGEELGMSDVEISWEDTQDPVAKKAGETEYQSVSRDPQRTPMQWSGEENAGFSTSNKTWLPVAENYPEVNVKAQLAHGAGVSAVETFSHMTLLRQQPSFQWGTMENVVVNENIFSFVRQAEGFKGYLVAINFGKDAATVNFHGAKPDFVPLDGVVAAHTSNFDAVSRSEDYNVGNVADLTGVYIKPKEGVVFWWEWGAPQEEQVE